MRLLTALTAGVLLSGCSYIPGQTYAELGAGYNTALENNRRPWDNADAVGFYGSVRQEWRGTERLTPFCQYSHYSQWLEGPPFNNRAESSLDHFGCALRYRIGD